MKQGNLIALVSRIKERANCLIIRELAAHGIEGLVPSHGDILTLLFRGGDFTMNELAEKIHRTKPTVTVLINKMAELGYVVREKSQQDSRVTYIRLTEKGLALQPAFAEISAKLNAAVYKGLSADEAGVLESLLEKVRGNLFE
jgi:MarR family transcriptional regulator, organic hydroperoxide resistance regulator